MSLDGICGHKMTPLVIINRNISNWREYSDSKLIFTIFYQQWCIRFVVSITMYNALIHTKDPLVYIRH